MRLKAKLTSDEFAALDDVTKSYYQETNDGYVLDADGVEDVTGLKSTLEKFKAEAAARKRELQTMNERLSSMDTLVASLGGTEGAEKLAELQARMEKDTMLKDLSSGDPDAIERVTKRLVERNTKDWEKKYAELKKQHDEGAEKLATTTKKLSGTIINNLLTQAAVKAGVFPGALEDVILYGRDRWTLDEDGMTALMVDPVSGEVERGKDGKSLTPDEWLPDLAEKKAHWFPGSSGGGSNSGAGNNSGKRQPWQITRAEAADFKNVQAATEAAKKQGKSSFELIEDT